MLCKWIHWEFPVCAIQHLLDFWSKCWALSNNNYLIIIKRSWFKIKYSNYYITNNLCDLKTLNIQVRKYMHSSDCSSLVMHGCLLGFPGSYILLANSGHLLLMIEYEQHFYFAHFIFGDILTTSCTNLFHPVHHPIFQTLMPCELGLWRISITT